MSEILAKTTQVTKQESTKSLLRKAGYIHKSSSGIYTLMELGQRVASNIIQTIQEELSNIGAGEISINQIQNKDLWDKTNRSAAYGKEMYQIKDRQDKYLVLSPTNEEAITSIAKQHIHSYKDLSKSVFCINNKFRDELRASNGLIRTKEFLMMDAYSFDETQEDLNISYKLFRKAIANIFKRLEIKYYIKSSDTGEVGGSFSEEFIANTLSGDIEIAHIFKLGDKYSSIFDTRFLNKDNQYKTVLMGCYGIGITRLIQVIADQHKKDNWLGWSKKAIAFQTAIVVKDIHNEIQQDKIKCLLESVDNTHTILVDDRNISIGKKIQDMKLMGFHDFIVYK